ncbi:protein-glutamate O-methyltransferase CheR [Shewanella sp. SR44-3]|uniref:CheR family methyltransferase n=1 Tax=unclassified Shewanella TaxID=196818 RepID=UPI0015FD123F|nr:protein-glutamate O-methyltransferase CheR [Shewanella sp. SR44-3]MBB1268337.1 protein-glutamate O-methyltransferase CheR [Shewanella sp. SR44-3]
MDVLSLSDKEFTLFQNMIYDIAGINLSSNKKALVSSRLAKRVKHFGLKSYSQYFELLKSKAHNEHQIAIDLLTTHETFFFREPKHFDFLRDKITPNWDACPHRVWSAASSSGEEAYTLAMVLAEYATNKNWEIIGTDISTQILERARSAHYAIERADNIPKQYLSKYCLKGVGHQEGTFIMSSDIRKKVQFIHANLKDNLSHLGSFEVIFLRNVLIYFDVKTKQQVVSQLLKQLKPKGYFIVGHSESLNGVVDSLKAVVPSVYQKI